MIETACSAQLPKRAAPPVPTRCQFCAQTLCDAYKRSPDCVPPGFPTLGSANACLTFVHAKPLSLFKCGQGTYRVTRCERRMWRAWSSTCDT